jgi:hypothetical protein
MANENISPNSAQIIVRILTDAAKIHDIIELNFVHMVSRGMQY